MSAADAGWMARAVRLAERGLTSTSPNPRVGCVLARDGQLLGQGWHQRAGEAHAEVLALKDAGGAVAGATAYVTLEPCRHRGRTGPCVAALLQAGIARLVYAVADAGAHSGGGGEELRRAGIAVEAGLLEAEARALNPGFHRRQQGGRPWLRLKWAQSLDGRSALSNGQSQWITGPAARADGQRWRARSCAVVTGIGTVLADDPQLNVRLPNTLRQPLRVVLDSRARTPLRARIRGDGNFLLLQAESSPAGPTPAPSHQDHGDADVVRIPAAKIASSGVDLAACVDLLAARGCHEILVEAGAQLSGAFLRAGLVDELVIYSAPSLLGDGRPSAQLGPLTSLDQRIALRVIEQRRIGGDSRIIACLGAAT